MSAATVADASGGKGSVRIDAHQHFWSLAHDDYGWLHDTPALRPIYRDFGAADLNPLLDAAGIDGSVLVQAAPAEAETRRLLAQASMPGSRVRGVVGWTDLAAPDAPQRIRALAREPLLKGLRPMLQDLPDPEGILGPALRPALEAMADAGLVLDLLIKPHQLEAAITLARRHPDLRLVLDHAAKPAIAQGQGHFEPWADRIARLAEFPQLHCKLSGLATEAAADWNADTLRPWVEHLLHHFGSARLMWGSDWPVVNLAGGYARWHAASLALLADLAPADRENVLGGNAMRCYGLGGWPGDASSG
jgi:L-fuconolactonase